MLDRPWKESTTKFFGLSERVFAVANRQAFILLPPEIQNQMMTIVSVSMLRQAQQATKAGSIERVLSLAGNMAGVILVPPTRSTSITPDPYHIHTLLNNDPKMMRTADEVAKPRGSAHHRQHSRRRLPPGERERERERGQTSGAG